MKSHRVIWPLVAAIVLAFGLWTEGSGLVYARTSPGDCKSQTPQAIGCQGSQATTCKPAACGVACEKTSKKACAASCPSAGQACVKMECASRAECGAACDNACSGACGICPSGVRGPRWRSIQRLNSDCSCGNVACRLYGLGCGAGRFQAARCIEARACRTGCGMECPKPCCAEKAVKKVRMSCSQPCDKPCCAAKDGATCAPGCTKPCCATDGVKKIVVMKHGSCDGGDILRATAECGADGARKVKKIRISTSDPDDEEVIVEELDGDAIDVVDSEGDGGAWLGVYLQDLTPELREAFDLPKELEGALITDVVRSGPARKAGVREGFVVVEYNGSPVRSADDLVKMVGESEPGDRVELVLNRKDGEVIRRVTLGKTPQERVILRETPGAEGSMRIDRLEVPDFDIEIPEIEIEGLHELGEKLHVLGAGGTYLGVGIESLDAEQSREYGDGGVLVNDVYEDTPADECGLKPGDIILEVDGEEVEDPDDLVEEIRSREPGDTIALHVVRGGNPIEMKAELDERKPARSMVTRLAPGLKMSAERRMQELQRRIEELELKLEHMKKELQKMEED